MVVVPAVVAEVLEAVVVLPVCAVVDCGLVNGGERAEVLKPAK